MGRGDYGLAPLRASPLACLWGGYAQARLHVSAGDTRKPACAAAMR
jgi:hypothetical protein